jgi:hypothetical protein
MFRSPPHEKGYQRQVNTHITVHVIQPETTEDNDDFNS